MKTKLLLTLLLLAPFFAKAKPSCCTPDAPTADVTRRPVSARSVYQIDATWTDDAGTPRKLAELRGEPVVLTMFFARCEYACPMLVNDMRKLRASLPETVRARARFVLVTFDPERDTVEMLRTYREAQGLDERWVLLRAPAADVQTLAMLLGVQYKRDARGQFAHSNVVTLLDSEGEIVRQRLGLETSLADLTDALTGLAGKPKPPAQM